MPFTAEQDKFLVEAYFRSGELQPNGEWKYSTDSCRHQFHDKHPEVEFQYDIFARYVNRLISRFRETGSVSKKPPPGKASLLTEEVLGNIQEVMDENPNKSLRRLSIEAGLSYGTCRNATKKLHLHPYKLQDAITNAVNDITEETLVNVFDSTKRRVNVCLENEGHHFEHML